MNSDPGAFSYDFVGPIEFDVGFLPAGWMPFIRLVTGDPDMVEWTVSGNTAHIRIIPPFTSTGPTTGQWYFELMLGHLRQPDNSTSLAADIHTVTFDEVHINDDEDPGSSGEWYVAANINGIWRQIFWDESVDTGDTIPLGHIPSASLAAENLTLQITAYEQDPAIDFGGEPLTPDPEGPDANGYHLGALSGLIGTRTLEPPNSNWRLQYTVASGGSVPPILVDEVSWAPRLADEPNGG